MLPSKTFRHFRFPEFTTGIFIAILLIFTTYSIFLSLNLQRGIIPDEIAHLVFSQRYMSTWGIPEDILETYKHGWYIEHNPFLYYWINGRVLNGLSLILPAITNWQQLVFLRLLNTLYAVGTVIFSYLLSKEIIQHKSWQLIPPFMLTNTLMFVFLSGGVNYDNLANLCSMAGLYFLVRVLNHKYSITNSLAWMLCIGLGTLVKYTILPLALGTGIAWLIFLIKYRKAVFPIRVSGKPQIVLGLLVVIVFALNLSIYGVNLVKFGELTPNCSDILAQEQCELSPYYIRHQLIGLDHKLTVLESIELGYPNPLEYVVDTYITIMFERIFGILAHINYEPAHIIIFFRLLFFWIILLAFRYLNRVPFTIFALTGIFLLYAMVLFYTNYNSELTYGFLHIAIQGRYIFPVIGAAYVLFGYILAHVHNKPLRTLTLLATLALFILGGPLKFITLYQAVFKDWFIP